MHCLMKKILTKTIGKNRSNDVLTGVHAHFQLNKTFCRQELVIRFTDTFLPPPVSLRADSPWILHEITGIFQLKRRARDVFHFRERFFPTGK